MDKQELSKIHAVAALSDCIIRDGNGTRTLRRGEVIVGSAEISMAFDDGNSNGNDGLSNAAALDGKVLSVMTEEDYKKRPAPSGDSDGGGGDDGAGDDGRGSSTLLAGHSFARGRKGFILSGEALKKAEDIVGDTVDPVSVDAASVKSIAAAGYDELPSNVKNGGWCGVKGGAGVLSNDKRVVEEFLNG